MASKEEEIIQFLRYVGNDVVPDGITPFIECEESDGKDKDGYGHCPDHGNCGICRFEYMKKKGWLAI